MNTTTLHPLHMTALLAAYSIFGNKGNVWGNTCHIYKSGTGNLCGTPALSTNWARKENAIALQGSDIRHAGCPECLAKYKEETGIWAVQLQSPAIAMEGDGNEYRFELRVNGKEPLKSTLHVERNFKKQGKWDGTPSGWYIGTLISAEGFYGNGGEISDMLVLDGGQKWYVTGGKAAIMEACELLNTEIPA